MERLHLLILKDEFLRILNDPTTCLWPGEFSSVSIKYKYLEATKAWSWIIARMSTDTNKFSDFLQTFYILKVTSKIDPPALSEGVFFPKVTCFPKEPICWMLTLGFHLFHLFHLLTLGFHLWEKTTGKRRRWRIATCIPGQSKTAFLKSIIVLYSYSVIKTLCAHFCNEDNSYKPEFMTIILTSVSPEFWW